MTKELARPKGRKRQRKTRVQPYVVVEITLDGNLGTPVKKETIARISFEREEVVANVEPGTDVVKVTEREVEIVREEYILDPSRIESIRYFRPGRNGPPQIPEGEK